MKDCKFIMWKCIIILISIIHNTSLITLMAFEQELHHSSCNSSLSAPCILCSNNHLLILWVILKFSLFLSGNLTCSLLYSVCKCFSLFWWFNCTGASWKFCQLISDYKLNWLCVCFCFAMAKNFIKVCEESTLN